MDKTFMGPDELAHIRKVVLGVSQVMMVAHLIDPADGEPINEYTLSRWESGKTRVPLWAARRIREFERVAKIYDEEVRKEGGPPE